MGSDPNQSDSNDDESGHAQPQPNSLVSKYSNHKGQINTPPEVARRITRSIELFKPLGRAHTTWRPQGRTLADKN